MQVGNKKYYIGIDLGGTFIKGGIITKKGEMIAKGEVPTETEKGADGVVANICKLADSLIEKGGIPREHVAGIGLGSPGMIDSENGMVLYAANLSWVRVPLVEKLQKASGFKVKITNDANAAALGEAMFGASKQYRDSVLITLGTGLGGGIIIDKKIFAGNRSAGAELGHMIIKAGGEKCTCGLKGCFEAYCSATALIRQTRRAMEKHKDSLMWEVGIENVNGKTPFDYYDKDPVAKRVVNNYLKMLTVGFINVANVFRPEAIILGGGISKQTWIAKPLQKMLDKNIFASGHGPWVKVEIAKLRNDAGTYGAAAMLFE